MGFNPWKNDVEKIKKMPMQKSNQNSEFVANVKQILETARRKAYSAVNSAMVEAYWLVGKHIVEHEQQGEQRAEYGAQLLKLLSIELNKTFGKGFDERELRKIRQFYLTFPIRDTLRPELGWSHYRLLIRVTNPDARNYYLREAAENAWTVRTLDFCSETDQDIARYSILNGNEQIFATKYKLYLPSEEELKAEIEREKMILKLQLLDSNATK